MAIIPGQIASGGSASPATVRQKSECYFTGLNLVIPTTPTNLINLIKNLTHTGSLAPFFNITTNKLKVVTTDILSFPTFFSVDKDGNLATNGSDITIQSNGATFTATSILLIAEQMVPTT